MLSLIGLQISESLSVMQQNEKQGISQMLERETRRERNLQDMEKKKVRTEGWSYPMH